MFFQAFMKGWYLLERVFFILNLLEGLFLPSCYPHLVGQPKTQKGIGLGEENGRGWEGRLQEMIRVFVSAEVGRSLGWGNGWGRRTAQAGRVICPCHHCCTWWTGVFIFFLPFVLGVGCSGVGACGFLVTLVVLKPFIDVPQGVPLPTHAPLLVNEDPYLRLCLVSKVVY